MSFVPKRRQNLTTIRVGSPNFPTYLENGSIESLLMSLPHYRLKSGAWSGGGPFYQVTDQIGHGGNRTFQWWFNGPQTTTACGCSLIQAKLNAPTMKSYLSDWSKYDTSMKGYTATGFQRTRPGNPIASVAQFVAELRDLPSVPIVQDNLPYVSLFKRGLSLRQIMTEARNFAMRSVSLYRTRNWTRGGGEYLNMLFGWVPFVRDLQKIYNLWQTIDRQMAQIIRDNGRGIRRRATLLEDTKTLWSYSARTNAPGSSVYGFPGDFVRGGGTTQLVGETTQKTKVWYSAKYRYYIPDISSSQWKTRAKLALFGALPTPEVVWELVPFSWLIDWAVNVGDVVSNMSTNAVDNLVQEYSYIMMSIKTVKVASAYCVWQKFNNLWPGGFANFTSQISQEIKLRTVGGSPYALNAAAGTPLSGYQLGILAALGLNLAS